MSCSPEQAQTTYRLSRANRDKPHICSSMVPDRRMDTVSLRDLAPAEKEADPVTAQELPAMLAPDTLSDVSNNIPSSTHVDYLEPSSPGSSYVPSSDERSVPLKQTTTNSFNSEGELSEH